MKLRMYQAYTMAQALEAVRRDLGADAVILNTRSFRRWKLPALWRRTIVEVTATPGRELAPKKREEPFKPANPASNAARRAYASQSNAPPKVGGELEQDRQRTRILAQTLLAKFERDRAAQARSSPNSTSDPLVATEGQPALRVQNATAGATKPAFSTARRFVLDTPIASDGLDEGDVAQENASAAANAQAMKDELAAIRTMVGQVLERQEKHGSATSPQMPQELFDMYLKLIEQDLSEELADTIVRQVRDELADEQWHDSERVRLAVTRHLAEVIPVVAATAPERTADGLPLTIALVGPTGVGKTTTVAKLAATYKLRHGARVGLVTSDTYRIAAVEQLRTYANIIGVPLEVVLTPDQMPAAFEKLCDCDVVLIDTAGRSQNDSDRIDELRKFIDAARPHEVHLVLSSTAGERVLLREAEAFAPVGVHKIVLTKLDEAVSFGMLVNVIRKVGKQLSFVTTGQEVPDDIEVGRGERIAELVLNGELKH